jgi:Asp-tRNA(Asn)/Glu-tRNA(Gln) amidotransferase A subunit family amidase
MKDNLIGITSTASASQLTSWIKNGEVSPVELLQATLAGIEQKNARVNAFVHLDPEEALRRARAVELALRRGEDIVPS